MSENIISNLFIYKAKLKRSIWLHDNNEELLSEAFYMTFKNTLVDLEKTIIRLRNKENGKSMPRLRLWNRNKKRAPHVLVPLATVRLQLEDRINPALQEGSRRGQ